MKLSQKTVQQHFARAASTYNEASVLQREVADRLFSRLQLMKISPMQILDCGARTGYTSTLLRKRYSKATLISCDLSEKLLQQHPKRWFHRRKLVCADYSALPFQNHSFDFIFSNLALHWVNQRELVLQEFFRILKPDGLLLFSTVGPDTLRELRAISMPTHEFTDMHDIGDLLLRTGFSDPVMDMEYLTLHYASVARFVADLKLTGTSNARMDQRRGLMGRAAWQRFMDAYHQRWQLSNNVIPATIEIIYGHAWMPRELKVKGEVHVPLSAIRRRA